MKLALEGKRALVMGASSGIGKAIAMALVAEGVKVAICARNEARLQESAKAVGAELFFACDLAEPGAGKKLVDQVMAKWQGIDILVTNTGGPPKGDFAELSTKDWQTGFQNLYLSVVDSVLAVLPSMKKSKWGRIVLITSAAAKEPMPKLTISNGLRAGLLGLTKTLSNEIASFGITINAVLPGYTDTDRLRELAIPEEKMTAQVPANRLGKPEETAALVTFLASQPAAYITGQAIACDGGYLRGI